MPYTYIHACYTRGMQTESPDNESAHIAHQVNVLINTLYIYTKSIRPCVLTGSLYRHNTLWAVFVSRRDIKKVRKTGKNRSTDVRTIPTFRRAALRCYKKIYRSHI